MNELLLLPLKWFLITLDLLITLVTFGWVGAVKKLFEGEKLRSVPVGDDPTHRVMPEYKGSLAMTPVEGLNTLYELSQEGFRKYADRQCMGQREYLGQHTEKVKKFGGTTWLTFKEVGESANKFGAALAAAGLKPAPEKCTLAKLSTPCSLAIFENTSPEWMISALGAFSQSVIVTTVYATLGIDAVVDAINDGVISAILCNKINVGKLVEKAKNMPTLKTIIYTNVMVAPDDKTVIPAAPKGMTIISFEDFVASGDTAKYPCIPPKPSTCAVTMYTSGSTGKPKGVIIQHDHVVSAIAAGKIALQVEDGDLYLGYLPLAHILELMAEFIMITVGCSICYADPKTLTTTGAYPIGALEQYSPTMMAGVPKVWDVIKKGAQAKIALSKPILQFLVKTAFEARGFAIANGYDTPLFKALVFKKFSKLVGGRLRQALSGGGPLNAEVQVFCRTCFGCPLIQGYGLTETCAGLTVQAMDDLRTGIAGVPIACNEAKLESCPDICDKAGLPYLATDRKDVDGNPIWGRGEILCKGGNISLGYYMRPEETKKVYDADGWFHTGDIGQFESDGSIKIIDRKKNLVKLKGGEYVALEKMEMTYGNSKFVDPVAGGICCYGDGDMDRPVALMQLNEVVAMNWAKENGIEGDFETVKKSKALNDAVLADMKEEARKVGLGHLEVLKGVVFVPKPWTPENGCLTAANKLQRRAVVSMFATEFSDVKKKGIF